MLIISPTKGNYHMKDWINHQIKLINANMSNVIIFPSERRQNQIEESERQKKKCVEMLRSSLEVLII